MSAKLLLHCGAREVSEPELRSVGCPPATATWYPLPHGQVLDTVRGTLAAAGFGIKAMRLALARKDARFFGTLDLENEVCEGVRLAVGVRNSTDKSLPIGLCAGSRVLVCDNLAFRSEITVARKHTRFGGDRFREAIARAVQALAPFREAEGRRITRFRQTQVTDTEAESVMLRAFEKGIVSHRLLPRVIREWRAPTVAAFEERTYWSLFNAFTTTFAGRERSNPQLFASLTLRLNDLLGEVAGVRAEEAVPLISA